MRYVTLEGEEERTAKPSEVSCPSCGADVGEPCLRQDGRGPATTFHRKRQHMANGTLIPLGFAR